MTLGAYYLWTYGIGIGLLVLIHWLEVRSLRRTQQGAERGD